MIDTLNNLKKKKLGPAQHRLTQFDSNHFLVFFFRLQYAPRFFFSCSWILECVLGSFSIYFFKHTINFVYFTYNEPNITARSIFPIYNLYRKQFRILFFLFISFSFFFCRTRHIRWRLLFIWINSLFSLRFNNEWIDVNISLPKSHNAEHNKRIKSTKW